MIEPKKNTASDLSPTGSSLLRILEHIVLAVGIVGPLTAVPQILKVYVTHDATGVSVFSWAIPALFDVPWILYGLLRRDRPIVVTYTLWLVMNVLVVIGAVWYGAGLS